ncbi:MAG: metal-dependent hydrolase, partial [Candidatus Latescibacterota bacterium]
STLINPAFVLGMVEESELGDEEKEMILRLNARKLLGAGGGEV